MALSIKNDKAERLARELALQTGESLTQAIVVSLEERLERVSGTRRGVNLEAIRRIQAELCHEAWGDARTTREILDDAWSDT